MKAHLALCMFLVGCVADPPSTDNDLEVAAKASAGSTCDEWECGTNSGQIELSGNIYDLPRLVGATNSTGYTLAFFGKRIGMSTYEHWFHKVENGVLWVRKLGTSTWLQDTASVTNVMWRLEKVVGGQLKQYEVLVTGKGNHPFVAKFNYPPGPATHAPQATTYTLRWREYKATWCPPAGTACPPPPLSDLCGENLSGDGMANFAAVIYEGDRIDPETIRVIGDDNPNNVMGCAGHALAKQHLGGYTAASARTLGWPVPSLARRTAFLKSTVADYLGIGISMTYSGVYMLRRDDVAMPTSLGGGYRLDTTGKTLSFLWTKKLEARWNEHGAICLNIPRVDFRENPEDAMNFTQDIEQILANYADYGGESHPRPPPCVGTYTDNVAGGYVTTVNYGSLPIIPL